MLHDTKRSSARAAHGACSRASRPSGRGLLGLALLALVCSGAPAQGDPTTKRPNFVFFLADDLGWRDLGVYGSTFYETPNLDRLASEGARFTNAYAACPVCSPTRASILTGKYPARMNTTDYFGGRRKAKLLPAPYVDHLDLGEVTIAEALKAAGYATFFAGKWHLGGEGFEPEAQGFDGNAGGFVRGHPPAGYFSPYKIPTLPDGPKGEHLTARLTDECLKFLDGRGEEPFLLYFSYYAVHTPLQTTPALEAKYTAKAAKLPPAEGPRFIPEGNRKARQVQDHAVYAGMMQSLDESVGRVLAKLEELGIADETIVIFMSDNGGLSTSEGSPTSNVPLRAGKGWLYEGGVREPMIVKWPGVTRPGAVIDTPVISTDFYPTMLAMSGLEPMPEQHVDGLSLVPLLAGSGSLEREDIFWHYPHYGNQGGQPGGAIRSGDMKLIEWFEDGRVELYDLARDLGEERDLSAERPEEVARLRAKLAAWRDAVDARMPSPNPDYEAR
ncbi:MAG: sulfatase [Planctomycetota bacterium]|nr:MAG: sulfatase [Planctomycetota bacterium]